MIRRARLIPSLRVSRWASADDHAEHEGWCASFEWLGLQVGIAIAGLTRSFDWPDGSPPPDQPIPGTPEEAPSGVSAERPAGPLRSGQSTTNGCGA